MISIPIQLAVNAQTSWANKVAHASQTSQIAAGGGDIIVKKIAGGGTVLMLNHLHTQTPSAQRNRGEWNSDASYATGDIVQVLSGSTYTSSLDASTISASIGTWLCVRSVCGRALSAALSGTISANTYPQYYRHGATGTGVPQLPQPVSASWMLLGSHNAVVPSSTFYQGEYNSLLTYGSGVMVRVSNGTSAGMWVVARGRTAAPGNAPTYPEPGNATWHQVAFGINQMYTYSGTTGLVYFNGLIT
jgi:hypothetical protein